MLSRPFGGAFPVPAKIVKIYGKPAIDPINMCTRPILAFLLLAAFVLTDTVRAAETVHGVRVVVLDAGHGGADPGACRSGLREKDITLKVVLRLGSLIEREMPGVKVVYTRTTDKALGATKAADLQARTAVANRAGADLFLSVHVNAAESTTACGVETLVMGESAKEQSYNSSALIENNRDDLIDMSDEHEAALVRAYIQNLQFTYGQYSVALARCIQESYRLGGRTIRGRDLGVKPQLLKVLYGTDMPSVLTEIGFLSNAKERAYLSSEKGLEEVVQALLRGVKHYSEHLSRLRSAREPEPQEKRDGAPEKPVQAPQDKPVQVTQEKSAQTAREEKEHYAVQILASDQPVPLASARFGSCRGEVKEYLAEGRFRYKYCVGEFAGAAEARSRMRDLSKEFPGAFVVRCRGSRIDK